MRPFIVFDIETKKTNVEVAQELKLKDEAAAFAYPHKLGFGCAVAYNSETDSYEVFRAGKELAAYLLKATGHILVGWNSIRFDLPVLLDEIDIDSYNALQDKPHLDLLADFYRRVNGRFRVSLDNAAQNTLGVGKIGNGADAPLLLRQGRWDELVAYCRVDVEITRRLFEFGVEHGHIAYFDRFENMQVVLPVDYKGYLEE